MQYKGVLWVAGRTRQLHDRTIGTPFDNGHDLIDGGRGDLLFLAVGPEDFQLVDLGGRAEAKVEAGVGAGCVAAAGEDVGALANAVDGEENFGADGGAGRPVKRLFRLRRCRALAKG